MGELAVAHATIGGADWFARWLGLVGIFVSVATVVVTIVLFHREGWALRLQIGDDRTPGHLGGGWAINITNVGRQACEVTEAGFEIVGRDGSSAMKFGHGIGMPMTVAPSGTVSVTFNPKIIEELKKTFRFTLEAQGKKVDEPPWEAVRAYAVAANRTYRSPGSWRATRRLNKNLGLPRHLREPDVTGLAKRSRFSKSSGAAKPANPRRLTQWLLHATARTGSALPVRDGTSHDPSEASAAARTGGAPGGRDGVAS